MEYSNEEIEDNGLAKAWRLLIRGHESFLIFRVFRNYSGFQCGKTAEQKKTLLRRQLEENNHFISFYVLSLYEVPLGDPMSKWTLFLQINDKNYAPIEIKTIELLPEYICFFGNKFNRFKVAYSVKFDAKDIEDMPLLTEETINMKLYFRSTIHEVVLIWDVRSFLLNVEKEDES